MMENLRKRKREHEHSGECYTNPELIQRPQQDTAHCPAWGGIRFGPECSTNGSRSSISKS